MVVCYQIKDLKDKLTAMKAGGQSIGLVPTMGALHIGHEGLVMSAKAENDIVVATLFINPTQFNNPEDYEAYPIDTEGDLNYMDGLGVDIVFVPEVQDMYPETDTINFGFGSIEHELEGKFRPGHFSGVGLVLSKLFNIVEPNRAYFGQKDIQQVSIVQKLVKDLFFNIEIAVVPTVREEDGLASSSRNRRLSPDQRKVANIFYHALKEAQRSLLENGNVAPAKAVVEEIFDKNSVARLEYFEVVDQATMMPLKDVNLNQPISLCIAGYIGEVRLLDNIFLDPNT